MNKLFSVSWKRLVSPRLALLAAGVLLVPCAANATPYVVKLTQQGSNVVASGSGEFDLSGLSFFGSGYSVSNGIWPSYRYVGTGLGATTDAYFGASVPASFGSGGYSQATSGTGDGAAVNRGGFLFVPSGYVSGTPLSNHSIFDNASFASLGVTPGTYVWTWGTAADRSFTLMIGGSVTPVPEPAVLGMFGLGVLLLGGFVGLRRRVA